MPKRKASKLTKRVSHKGDKGNTLGEKPRRNWKTRFLKALRKSPNVSAACEAAHISRKTAYQERTKETKESIAFSEEWDDVIEEAMDALEEEARRRAQDGLIRKKFTRTGDPIIDPATGVQYFEYEYSDALMQTLLRAHRPAKFREHVSHELTGKDGGPIAVKQDLSTLSDAELDQLGTLVAKATASPAALANTDGN